jgi:UDP-N-acetylmuramate dehydrogenase
VLTEVKCYESKSGRLLTLSAAEAKLGYRTSVFKAEVGRANNYNALIIIEAKFALRPGDRPEIESKMRELCERRNSKQPVELPSSGSYFKRPAGHFAGSLIEAAGLKGYAVGGAEVSAKHAGFIVNSGGATTTDVLAVAAEVKRRVREAAGVALEEEPVIIGEEAK